MVIANITPSTVDGIKQLAKKISRERNISHTEALDAASEQAGFENFVHAKRQLHRALPIGMPPRFQFPVYLSVHWAARRPDKDMPWPPGPRYGREIYRVGLSRPLAEIVAKNRVGRARGLQGFRMEYADHLEHLTNVDSQAEARDLLMKAVRGLRFMEVTGLQPAMTQAYRAMAHDLGRMPGRDHESGWFDPSTAGFVLLDEPYAEKLRSHDPSRTYWLARHGFFSVSPQWEGIYYPGACTPQLVGKDLALLQRVAGALANLNPTVTPNPWPHETGAYGDDFVSPQRQADAKKRRPRPGPSYRDYKGASPYGGRPGVPSSWRPSKSMLFELHRQLGALMKILSVGGFSNRVATKLGQARSELENWSLIEHKHQHGDEAYDLYYGGRSEPLCEDDGARLAALTEARAIVEHGYDDCKPKRWLLAALDAGISEMEKKTGQPARARRREEGRAA